MAVEAGILAAPPSEAFTPEPAPSLPAEAQDLAIPEPHPLAVRTFDNAMDTDGEDAPCVGGVCRAE